MSDNRTSKTVDITEHLRAIRTVRENVDHVSKDIEIALQQQNHEIERLQLALTGARDAHDKAKMELAATAQELSGVRQDAANWQKRFRDEEAKNEGVPKAIAEKWLEALGKSQLIGGLDRVIRGEAESNPADYRKRLVNWFGQRVNAKPEEVIAVGRQLIEKDSKAAAQIEWSPDTPFRDDVDAVEVEITYAGLKFGEVVIERARGNVIEVVTRPTTDTGGAAAEAASEPGSAEAATEPAEAADPITSLSHQMATAMVEPHDPKVDDSNTKESAPTDSLKSDPDDLRTNLESVDSAASPTPDPIELEVPVAEQSTTLPPNSVARHTDEYSSAITTADILDIDQTTFERLMASVDTSGSTLSRNQKPAIQVWIRICTGRTAKMKGELGNMYRSESYISELQKLRENFPDRFTNWLYRLDPYIRAYFESHWPGQQ